MGKGGLGKGRGKGESDNFGGSSPPTSPRTPPPKRQSTQESSGVCALPVCGGWCMPTENPDESCFRHFSNEWTIPAQPCFYACMPILEQNKCCFCIGGFGFQIPDGARKGLMCCALCLSFLAMILFALTFFGLHCDADGIKSWYWIKGSSRRVPAIFQATSMAAVKSALSGFRRTISNLRAVDTRLMATMRACLETPKPFLPARTAVVICRTLFIYL
eukprot:GEMP01018925.1.p1 GENE.GEMP01018925.1~~GEMP01018925.1.p1  ORF type:complete len:217 (+),score=31.25 GEMP01018925.1:166-816(+)